MLLDTDGEHKAGPAGHRQAIIQTHCLHAEALQPACYDTAGQQLHCL